MPDRTASPTPANPRHSQARGPDRAGAVQIQVPEERRWRAEKKRKTRARRDGEQIIEQNGEQNGEQKGRATKKNGDEERSDARRVCCFVFRRGWSLSARRATAGCSSSPPSLSCSGLACWLGGALPSHPSWRALRFGCVPLYWISRRGAKEPRARGELVYWMQGLGPLAPGE